MSKIKAEKPVTLEIIAGSYTDRTDHQKLSIIKDCMKDGETLVDEAIVDAKLGAKHLTLACKKIWRAGLKFAEAEDADQFVFKQWWNSALDWKADALRRARREAAIRAYRSNPEREPDNLAECQQIVGKVLEISQELFPKKRIEQQTAHERNLWNEWVDDLSTVQSLTKQLLEKEKLEDAPPERLEKIVSYTRPMAELNHRAKELLAASHD